MNSIHVLFKIILGCISLQTSISAQACDPPTDINHTWSNCTSEPESWYGLSTSFRNWDYAVQSCQAANSELLIVSNVDEDTCAFNVINDNKVFDEMVLFSGRYYGNTGWVWCPALDAGVSPSDGCTSSMNSYKNFLSSSTAYGNCMGGYLGKPRNFQSYGWIMRECSTLVVNQVRAICRYKC